MDSLSKKDPNLGNLLKNYIYPVYPVARKSLKAHISLLGAFEVELLECSPSASCHLDPCGSFGGGNLVQDGPPLEPMNP